MKRIELTKKMKIFDGKIRAVLMSANELDQEQLGEVDKDDYLRNRCMSQN